MFGFPTLPTMVQTVWSIQSIRHVSCSLGWSCDPWLLNRPPLAGACICEKCGRTPAIGPGDKVQGGGSGAALADVFRRRRFGSESLEANNSVRLISAWETAHSPNSHTAQIAAGGWRARLLPVTRHGQIRDSGSVGRDLPAGAQPAVDASDLHVNKLALSEAGG